MYNVKLKFACADKYRYKYLNRLWTVSGESEVIHDEARMEFLHPMSPSCGDIWMKKPVSFKNIKITHNKNSKDGNVRDKF